MQIKFVFIHRTVDIHAFSYLEQKSISQGIAEAEHKVLFGMFWYSLDNTVLHPDGMFGIAVVVNSWASISLIEEERATWKTNTMELLI